MRRAATYGIGLVTVVNRTLVFVVGSALLICGSTPSGSGNGESLCLWTTDSREC